jgi:benzodiazapine receptor
VAPWKSVLGLVAWLAVAFVAASIGARFVPGVWYEGITKPPWTPPDALFAPVWTVLYALMGAAAWLVWRKAGFAGGAWLPLLLFVVQLVLNATWSYLFFGAHLIGAAAVEILVLWAFILATFITFWTRSHVAGALLVPYLLWVGFASALNLALWRLNP